MNKKILLFLAIACMISAFAAFVYAGDTACGIGGCSATTVTTTTGTVQVISLNQTGTLTSNTLSVTINCSTNVTCFNVSNVNNYAVCNATTPVLCDGSRSNEYLNQQLNHTNLTNITFVYVYSGSLETAVLGKAPDGNDVIVLTSSDDDVIGNGNNILLKPTNTNFDIDDVRIVSEDSGYLDIIFSGRDTDSGNVVIGAAEVNPSTGHVRSSSISDTGLVFTPGKTTEVSDVVDSSNYGGNTMLAAITYDIASGGRGNGGILIGFGATDGQPKFGRYLTGHTSEAGFTSGGLEILDDVPIATEAGNTYATAVLVGYANLDPLASTGVFVGTVATDGVTLTPIQVYGFSNPVLKIRLDATAKGVPGSVRVNSVGQYVDATGTSYAAALPIRLTQGALDAQVKVSRITNAVGTVYDNSGGSAYGETAIMGTHAVIAGGSYVYQGYEHSTSRQSTIAVWDSNLKNAIKVFQTAGGMNGDSAIPLASKRANPAVYVGQITQTNGNTGTRVVVLEGSSLATAFEIYNFTTDSGDVLNFLGTGGHTGDYIDYVLGGRFPQQTNNSAWLDYFNTSLAQSAINPNGTTRFTTDKQVVIQTMHPDINILNFQLDFQAFNGTFDTTLGTCVNCTYDLGNGTCQAEVEKVWGMFQNYRLNMTLTTASAITMTNLTMECRTANATVTKNANCASLFSTYGVGTDGCVSWLGVAGRSWVIGANGGVGIDMTNFTSASFGLGNITPTATCEQIACEVTGIWKPGDTQEFVMNKTITVTAI